MDRSIEPDLWCRGCVRKGARDLADTERTWIQRLRRAHRARVAFGLVIVPAALMICIGLASLLPPGPGGPADVVAGTALFVTLLLGVPVSILLVRDHLTAARRLDRDLESGSAWIFESTASVARSDATDGDDAHREAVSFALLPGSRRLIDPRDLAPRTTREDVIEVEPHTGAGFYVPCAYAVVSHPPGLRLEQRGLSGAEREELERVAGALLMPTLGTMIALGGFIAIVTMVVAVRPSAALGTRAFVGDSISTVLWILVTGRILVRYWRCIRLASHLRGDLAVGIVLRAAGDQDSGTSSPSAGDVASEFLPVSRLLWRTAGAPIGWRDRREAAKRLRLSL
jgi:hypothetical protein